VTLPPRSRSRGLSPRRRWALVAVVTLTVGGVAVALLWPRSETPVAVASLRVSKPEFVTSFGAEGPGALIEPVGMAVDGDKVSVADAGRGEVVTFSTDGVYVRAFGKGRLPTPTYVARNPLDGRLYVSDRRLGAIMVFSVDGSFVGTFTPAPDDVAGAAVTAAWRPLGLAFGDDGTMYVSDVGARQRIVSFGPTRRYLAETATQIPGGALSFVNGLAAVDGSVLAADSNNSRLVTLGEGLGFVRSAAFAGLPRGMSPIPGSRGGAFAVVDTTGGDVRIVTSDGSALARLGSPGSGEGQLSQPTAVALDAHGMLYVSDTGNARISVWSVSATRSSDLFTDALRDPRWWAAVVFVLAGVLASGYLILSGRKRLSTI
jgi:tripartite motif-containing protein 71